MSNSKSEDTPEEVERPAVEKCIYCDQPLKQGLIRGMLHKCEAWKAEPPQDATIHDVVNGTPKGQEAVQKAIDDSIKVQNEMSKEAQDTSQQDLIDFVTNPETIKKAVEGSMDKRLKVLDTSLDDILAILDDHHSIVTDELGKSCAKELLAWHKAERAKLFEQIRSEVIKDYEDKHQDQTARVVNKLRAEQLEALTRLEQK